MDYNEMSREELKVARDRLANDLVDLEEITSFNFANSPDHVNASVVKREEDKLDRMRAQVAEMDTILGEASD